jgi:hypothetical protein
MLITINAALFLIVRKVIFLPQNWGSKKSWPPRNTPRNRRLCSEKYVGNNRHDTLVLVQGLPEPAGELPEPGRDRLRASLHCLQGGKSATQRRGETVIFVSLFLSLLSFRIGTGGGEKEMGGRTHSHKAIPLQKGGLRSGCEGAEQLLTQNVTLAYGP